MNFKFIGLEKSFINLLMKKGFKFKALNFFFLCLCLVRKKTGEDPIKIFRICLYNIRPLLCVKIKKIRGRKCEVPSNISLKKSNFFAMLWVIDCALKKSSNGKIDFVTALSDFIIEGFLFKGALVKKRLDFHSKVIDRKPYLKLWP